MTNLAPVTWICILRLDLIKYPTLIVIMLWLVFVQKLGAYFCNRLYDQEAVLKISSLDTHCLQYYLFIL